MSAALEAPPILDARSVSLDYGARRVLEDVSLTLHAGEVVAILGASGAGKSSLLRALSGLQAPSSGTVYAFGEPLRGVHPGIAVGFQDACLLPWRDVEKNVAFGLDFARQPPCSKKERRERVAEALSMVELSHAARYRPHQLSGGMAQRVALARCLARRPRALLLDEPFGALDEVTRGGMQQTLLKLVRTLGTAVLLVTHDIDEAVLLADRVILLGGRPAGVRKIWHIALSHPREQSLEAMSRERLEIVKCLRETVSGEPSLASYN